MMRNEQTDLQIEAWVDELGKALSNPTDYSEAGRIVKAIMQAVYDDVARLQCPRCGKGEEPNYDTYYAGYYHERELCYANIVRQRAKEILG